MALVYCAALPLKLHHFFEFAARAREAPFPLEDRAALARHLSINRARISEWTQRDDSKNREPNMVQDEHVARLASLYCRLSPLGIDEREAYRYWREVPAEVFRDGLVTRHDHRPLFALFEERQAKVQVALIRRQTALGMVDEMEEPENGEIVIRVGKQFALEVTRLRGKSAFVLVESGEGLHLLIPSKRHDGRLRSSKERIPSERWWNFATPGPHRVIAIEMGCESPPVARAPNRDVNTPLNEAESAGLAEALLDPGRVPVWNWGELSVHVNGAPTEV